MYTSGYGKDCKNFFVKKEMSNSIGKLYETSTQGIIKVVICFMANFNHIK